MSTILTFSLFIAASAPSQTAEAGQGTCVPACQADQQCLETSKGFRCIGSANLRAPNTRSASRAGDRVRYRQFAKAPAITLGVLSLIGGVSSFALAGAAAGDQFNDSDVGVFVAAGIINTGLGLWGIIGGATSGYVDESGRRIQI